MSVVLKNLFRGSITSELEAETVEDYRLDIVINEACSTERELAKICVAGKGNFSERSQWVLLANLREYKFIAFKTEFTELFLSKLFVFYSNAFKLARGENTYNELDKNQIPLKP